jgi:hypothetical protein
MEVLNYVELGPMLFVLKVHFMAAIIITAVCKQFIFFCEICGSECVFERDELVYTFYS